MPDVKSPAGSLRATRAAETRHQIEEAARLRFGGRGYAATTLREVAAEAGVAVQTVYATFGSKAAILRSLRLRVVGDTEADAAWGTALDASTVPAAIDAFSRSIRLRWEHGADIVAANTDAARTDPAIRAEVEAAVRVRRTGIALLAERLVELEPRLKPVDQITATLEALTVTDVYAVLTGAHGWSPDDYEAWLRRAITDALEHAAHRTGAPYLAGGGGPARASTGPSASPGTRRSRAPT
jgi:AcrR family transcriptional regulator